MSNYGNMGIPQTLNSGFKKITISGIAEREHRFFKERLRRSERKPSRSCI